MAKFYTPGKLSENIRSTPEGFLVCLDVPIARTGEMLYGEGETPLEADEDGKVVITREADEVFSPITIASFEGKSVTIRHPEKFVDPSNWSYLSKGIVQNVRRSKQKDDDGEESLLADLLITEAMAIQLVKSGLREVSCGYEAEYEQTGKGRGRQTKIVGNHLALVEEGRAGSSYAINDHKGKVSMLNKLKEQLNKLTKTVDEAAAGEKKEEKAKDAEYCDAEMYDELVKMVKDLGDKVEGMKKAKDADKSEEKKDEPKAKDEEKKDEEKKDDEKAKDADEEEKEKSKDADSDEDKDSEILERVKALEAAVAKMLESKDEDLSGGESEDEDMEESEDAEEEKKDDKKEKTGDKKADLKDTLGNKEPSKTFDQFDNKSEVMTAEKLNELNAALWARK